MRGSHLSFGIVLLAVTGFAACGGGNSAGDGGTDAMAPDTDAGDDGGESMRCGNMMVEGAEECDDGNRDPDDGCSADCALECGDGMVGGDELCDSAIAEGEAGACPTACDDGDACTTDGLDGAGCALQCLHGPITAAVDGDGCCPPGADSTTDADCTGVCGNGVVETGETCDTSIAAGEAGACPSGCDDSIVCTTDTMTGTGCTAACTNDPITTPVDGDSCCPSGATSDTDADCAGCGDGMVMAPETCDTAISSGAGACPTACDDGIACTTDALVAGGTCMAACSTTPITAPADGDGCCPAGANVDTDGDCVAACGDSVVTAPEECDDGNTVSGDGCSSTCTTESLPATAFRFTDLDLRDPHVYASVAGCQDATNTVLGVIDGLNPIIEDNIAALGLNVVHAFSPLMQTAGSTSPGYVGFPMCTTATSCTLAAGATRYTVNASNVGSSMVCLDALPGTTNASYTMFPVILPEASGTGTCYVGMGGAVAFNLGPISITLSDTHIGGEWSGNPATMIGDGLIRGFLSEEDANATIIPDGTTGFASVDCQVLASLLPGGDPPPRTAADPAPPGCADGTGAETPSDPPASCAPHDDMDVGPGGERGWYIYLNFEAARLSSYTEN